MKILCSDPQEIARTLKVLFQAGAVVEMRIPKTERDGTVSGYFADHAALAKQLAARNGDAAVYVTMNPVAPALLARCANRVKSRVRTTTGDKDIGSRLWLLIDCDPVRPADISSTDAEHEAALELARRIRFELAEEGWPPPVLADSGNGWHLLWLVDLPNDDASTELVKAVLKALSARFSDAAVKVDETVYNAARIVKAYGTVACKGDNTSDRPHRLSRLLDVPNALMPVPRDLLHDLAASAPRPALATNTGARTGQFNLEAFLARHLQAREPKAYEGGRKWAVDCPFNPEEHGAPDAAVFEHADGSLGFKCLHASCSGRHWRDVRELFERRQPGANSRKSAAPPADKQPPAEEKQERLPAFPEIAWRGIFQNYRAANEGTTEACDATHFATLWVTSATILERKVEMYAGDVIYPNVYLNNFGETGDKKTTGQRRIAQCNLLEHCPHIRRVPGVGSTEGLADALKDAETGVYLFQWEEFATFLSQARWTGSTLLEFITECFDCPPEWNKQYRNRPIHLKTPTPSILTATTAEWFWKYAKADDFFGGFGNRFLFFTGARKALLPNPSDVDSEAIAHIKEHLKIIASHPPCRVEWTPGAKKLWDAFYVEFESAERSSLLRAATKRAHVYVRKLAMTYAALEQTLPHIDPDQLEAAIAVVMHSVACTERLLDLQAAQSKPQGELEQQFLRWVAAHEGERVRRLQQLMWKYCGDSETFNRVLQSLQRADRIEITERRVYLST